MATREGLDTTTEEERSLFSKLSVSLHFNTLIIPILLAFWQSFTNTGSFRISQAWYETGGIIDGFAILAISNVAIDGLLQMFPLDMYINRWVLAPFTISQYKLNRLMLPPEMPIAYLHAISFKTISLCLLYSAIYPPAYLLTVCLHACNPRT